MPKVVYSPAKGLVQESGTGVVFEGESISFAATPFTPVQTVSTTGAITSPGVYAITSSTGGAKTVTLPVANLFPGGTFIFRSLSADAHVIAAASADGKGIAGQAGVAAALALSGSNLALGGKQGFSVVLVNDGQTYCVTGGSGSFSIT